MSEVFYTDTTKVKNTYLAWTAFSAMSLLVCSYLGGHDLTNTLTYSTTIPAGLLAILWAVGHFTVFDRTYTVDETGITLAKNDKVLCHIPWQHVARIGEDHLLITAKDKTKIAFNVPLKTQEHARMAIEEYRRNANAVV